MNGILHRSGGDLMIFSCGLSEETALEGGLGMPVTLLARAVVA